jgi:hypothetical protein
MGRKISNMLSYGFACTTATFAVSALAQVQASPTPSKLPCDESLKTKFQPDQLTRVVLVKYFKAGDSLSLAEPVTTSTPRAANALCLVKLLVGPGNPGPANAPSTSPGIGIEVWLPAPDSWNNRVHALGGGGWVGGPHGSPGAIAELRAAAVADLEGAVSSSSDAGHPRAGAIPGRPGGGDFAMNPDGTVNSTLLRDFASRSMHEQAVKTKALATAYYGRAPRFSYWDGSSQGGRQALSLAQNHPDDFDGIIGNLPAINWSRATGTLYPQIVFQRDLAGVAPSRKQLDLLSNAAISACDVVGGQHLGFIIDIASCRYDPTKDLAVLCPGDGGRSQPGTCVTRLQAQAVNKIWYGMTSDGSVPEVAADNGWKGPLGGVHRWYGLPRGTSLYNVYFSTLFNTIAGLADPGGPYTSSTDKVALELQNPTMASTNFENATGNGEDLWKTLSYAQLSNALDRGLALQPVLGHIDTDKPDLSEFKARGGKMLTWQGIHDEVIPVQGTIHYYNRVIATMGGLDMVSDFYKLFIVPGLGHQTPNGTSNPAATPPVVGRDQFYQLLTDWVERGVEPRQVVIKSPAGSLTPVTLPLCPYPDQAVYGRGDPHVSTSYSCKAG